MSVQTEFVILELEQTIAAAKKVVNLGEVLKRLRNNPDFKTIIMEEYFEKEAIRLVHLKGAPDMQSETSQKAILVQIDAISSLSVYLTTILQKANMASRTVEDGENELTTCYSENDISGVNHG